MLKKIFIGVPRRFIIFNACFTVVWGIMNSYFTVALSKVTAAKIIGQEFFEAALFFIGYILLWELIEFICDYCDGMSNAYIRSGNYNYYYQKLYYTKPEHLQRGNTGYIAGILAQLIERKCAMTFNFLLSGISIIYIVYLIIYIRRYSIWFSIIVGVLALIGVMIRLVCSKLITRSLKNMTIARGELTRIFMDGINNITTVQKLRGLSFIEMKSVIYNKCHLNASRQHIIGNEIGFCLYKTINYMLCPICMFMALHIYKSNPTFPIVEFMAYLSIVTVQLVHNVKNVAEFIKNYNLFVVSQREMDKIIEEQSMIYTSTSIGSDFDSIAIRDISYQYNIEQGSVTIDIPEFTINKGEKVCITGESGQGKTTLLKLLSGMIETNGKLYVNGVPITNNIDAVYIAQDTEMLDMNLRDNLTFGNTLITDEALIEMIQEVGMGDWYIKQSNGLDTLLGERGVFLSTGQRQRLNILRGLLMDKEIYLLDEPTSNVDDITEDKIINLIQRRLTGKTVIIVTHKEKICKICDREYCFRQNIMIPVNV